MPTWHLARGGISISIARVQAHFYSAHSSRQLRWLSVAFVAFVCDALPKQVSLLAGYTLARMPEVFSLASGKERQSE